MSTPTADVSCRIAWADDAPAIAGVQLRTWRTDAPHLLPQEVLDGGAEVEEAAVAELSDVWLTALARPQDARQRVLVALERATVTGFALTGPAGDPDADPAVHGELLDLVVDPARRGQGHGSRLLQAGVDTLRADRFDLATTWVVSTDDARRRFLVGAGWATDGAHRTLEGPVAGEEPSTVQQVRLHTDLGDDADG